MTAIGCPTAISVSSVTNFSIMRPVTGDRTSTSTLSVPTL